jgi:hypothetical protein
VRANPCCVWCPEEELEVHLFVTSLVALAVWSKIYKWLGNRDVSGSSVGLVLLS